jgi:hypothetical protein
MSVLPRSNAVNYAVKGQDASGPRFGEAELKHPPMIDRDIQALLNKGVPVNFVRKDSEKTGDPRSQSCGGAKAVSRCELPGSSPGPTRSGPGSSNAELTSAGSTRCGCGGGVAPLC